MKQYLVKQRANDMTLQGEDNPLFPGDFRMPLSLQTTKF